VASSQSRSDSTDTKARSAAATMIQVG
jgi:hypothetical protein